VSARGDLPPILFEVNVRFGIRSKVVLALVLAGIFPLGLFGGILLYLENDRLRADAEQGVQSSAERIQAQVDEWFDKNHRVLVAAAGLPAIGGMDPVEQTRVLLAIQRAYPWMYLTFVIDPQGHNTARSDGKPLVSYADRQYFKDVIAGKKELSWETLISKTTGKPAIVMALPIRANGEVVGVLAAGMSIEDVSNVLARWKTGRSGFAFLVDEQSKVLAHPFEEYVGRQMKLDRHPAVAAYRADRAPHLLRYLEQTGRSALGYAQGNRFDWVVVVQQDEDEVLAPLRQSAWLGLSLLGLTALLVAAVAAWASRLLVRPIVELTRAADAMSKGELETPIRSARKDELGELSASVERLRRSMKAAMDRIRQGGKPPA
jgi:methyl-accepting chemotaxis protein